MTVHIREFVMRLGVEAENAGGRDAEADDVTRVRLEELRQELLREIKAAAGSTKPQPFDR